MEERSRRKPDGRDLANVIFEFSAMGNSVKFCAVDPVTGLEIAIVGPPGAGEAALRRTAMAKLSYMLEKRRPATLSRWGLYV